MFALAVTNRTWFEYQRSHSFTGEVNFWTPSRNCPHRISPGEQFVFKLAGDGDLIGGYGTFVEYKYQSLDDTWKEFGPKNGADTKAEFFNTLKSIGSNNGIDCGCVVLKDIILFEEPVNRVKAGITAKPAQLYAYEHGSFPFDNSWVSKDSFSLVKNATKKKIIQNVTERKGQSAFHAAVSKAYNNQCCITGESTPELLQAAHIQDYINQDSHHIQNGLLLRIDIHKLFDSGLLYIDQHYHVHVSPLVTTSEYKRLENKQITLPNNPSDYPSLTALLFKETSFRK